MVRLLFLRWGLHPAQLPPHVINTRIQVAPYQQAALPLLRLDLVLPQATAPLVSLLWGLHPPRQLPATNIFTQVALLVQGERHRRFRSLDQQRGTARSVSLRLA